MDLAIAIFASGRGSNCKAILDAIAAGKIPRARVVCVISNNSGAGVLELAREHGITALHLSRQHFASDDEFTATMLRHLQDYGVNFIVLAGYMKMIDPAIIAAYRNRIINIHPALLPTHGGKGMYGIHVHEAVIAAKERTSGATVHIVDEHYDHGPVVLQRTVNVAPDDTPETLAAKVLQIEHEIYPEALRLFAADRVMISNGRLSIRSRS